MTTRAAQRSTRRTATVAGTTLTAPIAGTVTAINGSVGGIGSASRRFRWRPGSPARSSRLHPAGRPDQMQVAASFAEADATKLKDGQAATVTLERADRHDRDRQGRHDRADRDHLQQRQLLRGGRRPGHAAARRPARPDRHRDRDGRRGDRTRCGSRPRRCARSAPGTWSRSWPTARVEIRTVEVGVEGDTFIEITSGLTAGEQVVIVETTTTGTTGNGRPASVAARRWGGGGFGGGAGGAGGGGGGRGGTAGGGGTG